MATGLVEDIVITSALGDLNGPAYFDAAARAAFDAICCMRAGATGVPDGGKPNELGDVTVIGSGWQAPLLDAIGQNAAACHVLDRDDLHWPSMVHPGGIIWPVAFGVGESVAADVAAVLTAGAVGYQVMARMSLYLGAGHRRHFHATTTCGTVGAAAVAAVLRDEDPGGAARAACSVLGGTRQALAELSDTAVTHRAHAAIAGVVADRFASKNPVAEPVTGSLGFAAATTPLDHSFTGPLNPVVGDVTVRSHPVSGFAHTMVDALGSLPALPPSSVRSVRVVLPETLTGADRGLSPTNAQSAGWAFPIVAALAITGRLPVRVMPWPVGDDVWALARRIEIVAGPPETPGSLRAQVEVVTDDGTTLTAACSVPHGHPGDPLTDGELVTRGVNLGAFTVAAEAQAVLDALRQPALPIGDVLNLAAKPLPLR